MGDFPQLRLLLVAFFLVGLVAVSASANQAPVVDSSVASPSVVLPDTISVITVEVYDPDCISEPCTSGCGQTIRSDLTFWEATGGVLQNIDNGVIASPNTATAEWVAPSTEGIYTVSVTLYDSGSSMCGGRQATQTSVDILVSNDPNQAPVIDSFTSDRTSMYPGRTANLLCSASDPDGDPITYSWSTDRGTVTPGSAGEAVFVGGDPGVATVSCTATDSNGAPTSDNVFISVTDAYAERRLTDLLVKPSRIAVDDDGMVYVLDPANKGVTLIDLTSGVTEEFIEIPGATCLAVDWAGDLVVGTDNEVFVVDPVTATIVLTLEYAQGVVSAVAADPVAQRYGVLHRDSGRIFVYRSSGIFYSGFGRSSDDASGFEQPRGLAFTPEGWVVVADSGHGQIKVFSVNGVLLNTFGGLGGGAGEFIQLTDVTVDDDGIIYAVDAFKDRVTTFNPGGTLREIFGSHGDDLGQLQTPTGVAVNTQLNRLLVASQNTSRIEVFALAPPVQVPMAVAALSTESLTFTDQPVGTTSSSLTVQLSSIGEAPLSLSSVTTSGDFTATHGCDTDIEPGSSCVVSVSFTPATTGARNASLELATSDGAFSVSLSGLGVLPAAAVVSQNMVTFGRQVVGTTSATQWLTLTNYGSEALAVNRFSASWHFVADAGDCGGLVAGSSSCTFGVRFAPDTSGNPLSGLLIVDTSAGARSVSLGGLGVTLELSPDRSSVDLGTTSVGETSHPKRILVTNNGDEAVFIDGIQFGGSEPDDFKIVEDSCALVTLPVGSSCGFQVVHRPTLEGEANAEVVVLSGAPFPATVSLSGVGTLPIFADDFESGDVSSWDRPAKSEKTVAGSGSRLSASRPYLSFGTVELGAPAPSLSTTLVNAGDEGVVIGSVKVSGDVNGLFLFTEDTCTGSMLTPGSSCSIGLLLRAEVEGHHNAELRILGAFDASLDGRLPISADIVHQKGER